MDKILLLIIILTIITLLIYIFNIWSKKQKKIKTKIYKPAETTSSTQIKSINYTGKPSVNSLNRSIIPISKTSPHYKAPTNEIIATHKNKNKLKKGDTSYYRLNHTTFYANWAQFWPGGPDLRGVNSPTTFQSFIGKTDKIIYGFLLFGVTPNPALKCNSNIGPYLGRACQYVPFKDKTQMLDTTISWFGYMKDIIEEEEFAILQDFLEVFLKQIVDAIKAPPQQPYISSGGFSTFPPYPNECFTGCNSVRKWGGLLDHCVGSPQDTECPSNGRLHDFHCFDQLQGLKQINSNLNVVASYGGWSWTHGGAKFSNLSENLYTQMVSTPENRSVFIDSSFKFLTKYGFNGVDFDWEYPGQKSAYDFYGFECLIREYKQRAPHFVISIQCSGFLSGNVVTMNMESLPGYKEDGIQLTMESDLDYFIWMNRLLEAGLDNINIMAYDYYTVYSTPYLTRPNAPLYNKDFPNPNYVKENFSSTTTTAAPAPTTTSAPIPFNRCSVTKAKDDELYKESWFDPTTVNFSTVTNKSICEANNITTDGCTYKTVRNEIPLENINVPQYGWVSECKPTSVCTQDTYTIKAGDTMYDISQKYNITLDSLCSANDLTTANCGNINVGQIIKLPEICKLNYPVILFDYGLPPADPIDDIDYCLSKTLAIMESVLKPSGMKKVVLGLACYGRTFSGINFGNLKGHDLIDKTVGLPFSGLPAGPGSYSGEAGILSYHEINSMNWDARGYNKQFGTSIAVNKLQGLWVSFDDNEALLEKMEVARKYNVGGVMTFTPQQDDFSNGYPLMQTVTNNL